MTDAVIDEPHPFSELRRTVPIKITPPGPYHMYAEIIPGTALAPMYGQSGVLTKILNLDGQDIYPFREGPPEPMHAWMHRDADQMNKFGYCYFIGGDEGAIKIGHTVSLRDRLRTIQSHSPIPVRILASVRGGEPRERAYHRQFDEHRLHGEWFSRHPDILAEIARLTPITKDKSHG